MCNEIEKKQCIKCLNWLDFDKFRFRTDTKKIKNTCKNCQQTRQTELNIVNKSIILKRQAKYRLNKIKQRNYVNPIKCPYCDFIHKKQKYIIRHIITMHNMSYKEYYDNTIKKPNEAFCCICNRPTFWDTHRHKYSKHCSKQCRAIDPNVVEKKKQTCLSKYGVKHVFQSKEIREKILKTTEKHYGKPYLLQTKNGQSIMYNLSDEQLKQKEENRLKTNLKRYGTKHPCKLESTKQKMYDTCIDKYGVKNPLQNSSILKKRSQTNINKYGGVSCMSDIIVKNKMMKTHETIKYNRKECLLPSGKIVKKQGYEPQFLDYVFKNNILKEDNIIYFPNPINYIDINNIKRSYYPDFYVPKWNLIIEIKSSWTILQDKNMYLKESSTINCGFKYIRIINNNFEEFLKFTQQF